MKNLKKLFDILPDNQLNFIKSLIEEAPTVKENLKENLKDFLGNLKTPNGEINYPLSKEDILKYFFDLQNDQEEVKEEISKEEISKEGIPVMTFENKENPNKSFFIDKDITTIRPMTLTSEKYLYVGIPLFDYVIDSIKVDMEVSLDLTISSIITYPNGKTIDMSKYHNNLKIDSDYFEVKDNFYFIRFSK